MAAAYIGEIFRSGIQSVEAGQLEASRALGFSYSSSMRLVVVPQGVRRVLPALVNQFISLLKASSLVYFLGLVASQRELFQVGRDLNAQTGNLSPLVAAGLFYLMLTIPLTHLVNYIDARLRRGRPRPTRIRWTRAPRARRWCDGLASPGRSRFRWPPTIFTWRSAATGLRGVDLDVPAGTTTAVIGPSGSGKSTLLRTLNRLYEPDRGDILLDGRSVLRDDPDKLRQRIGMVFQQFNLFPHRSVLDNVDAGAAQAQAAVRRRKPASSRWPSWSGSGCGTRPTCGRPPCPAGSSSGSRSPGRWRWPRR